MKLQITSTKTIAVTFLLNRIPIYSCCIMGVVAIDKSFLLVGYSDNVVSNFRIHVLNSGTLFTTVQV
jgi:hypothetical protein